LIGGVNLQDVFIVHFITIAIGQNHANLGWDYGFEIYFNNPKMHIWHHSKKLPNKYGVNFEFHYMGLFI
jgi:sterol desaturase/sphingolipid hydroxylase (fatty acid hydroxylase superfamily)